MEIQKDLVKIGQLVEATLNTKGDKALGTVVAFDRRRSGFCVIQTSDNQTISVNQKLCKVLQENVTEITTKDFVLFYDRDMQEGRGYRSKGVVRVIAESAHREFAVHWAFLSHGSPVGFVEGSFNEAALLSRWELREADPHSEHGRFIDTTDMDVLVIIDPSKNEPKNFSTLTGDSVLSDTSSWRVYECGACGHKFAVEVDANLVYDDIQCPDVKCEGSGRQSDLNYVEGEYDKVHYI